MQMAVAGQITRYVQKATSFDRLRNPKKGGTQLDSLSNNPKVLNPILVDDANSAVLIQYLWAKLFSEDPENS